MQTERQEENNDDGVQRKGVGGLKERNDVSVEALDELLRLMEGATNEVSQLD